MVKHRALPSCRAEQWVVKGCRAPSPPSSGSLLRLRSRGGNDQWCPPSPPPTGGADDPWSRPHLFPPCGQTLQQLRATAAAATLFMYHQQNLLTASCGTPHVMPLGEKKKKNTQALRHVATPVRYGRKKMELIKTKQNKWAEKAVKLCS